MQAQEFKYILLLQCRFIILNFESAIENSYRNLILLPLNNKINITSISSLLCPAPLPPNPKDKANKMIENDHNI